MKCVMLFRNLLGVPLVNSNFGYYKDTFLFAISMLWGVEVIRFSLKLHKQLKFCGGGGGGGSDSDGDSASVSDSHPSPPRAMFACTVDVLCEQHACRPALLCSVANAAILWLNQSQTQKQDSSCS